MDHHYVLAPHDPELADRARSLIEVHAPGRGVRAIATAQHPSDFAHVIAIQASDDATLRDVLAELRLDPADVAAPEPGPVVLTVCDDLPCQELLRRLGRIVPSQLPPSDYIAFLLLELVDDLHAIIDEVHLPPLEARLAGAPVAGGRRLLLELASDDREQLARDLERVTSMRHAGAAQLLHTGGGDLVRSPRG